jgi:Protein of unknown function (DUF2844)
VNISISKISNLSAVARILLGFAVGVAAAPAARAALGGDVESIAHDHEALRSADVVTPTLRYDLHESQSVEGLRVRQYVDRVSGRVFAVSWEGPRSPDVSGLLGSYSARYAAAARAHRGNHHVLSIDEPDLQLTIMRLPRGWQGQAYLPAAIPEGVDRAEIR